MSKNKEFTVEVSQAEHNKQLAEGLLEDEILSVGKHNFKRGGFRARHPNFKSKDSKTRINICVDSDILQHFRKRAESANSAPYQTQINNELRAIMKRDLAQEKAEIDATAKKLLEDDDFLKALSEKLKEKKLQTA
ncbi:MAG TPA: BrnA antitoxin family protein [Pyrinomonadaceae bacterium]|nr:BrnA antitoxin family protein [Pyrinomonadaceae bacterium]